MEQWLPVVGFEGLYEVSDQGRVRSLPRVVIRRGWGGNAGKSFEQRYNGLVLRPGIASHGYPTVSLNGGGVRETHSVHELVLKAFVGPCPEGMECRHMDGVRTNPRLVNLAWGTHTENVADMAGHGTKLIGERYSNAKLTDLAAAKIRSLKGVVPQSELAVMFGVSPSAIQAVHDGRTWKLINGEAA